MSHELECPDDVRAWLAGNVYRPQHEPIERIGVELEMFPFWLTRDGLPAARLALVEVVALVGSMPGARRLPDAEDGRPSWAFEGAVITEEPGAQIEIAGPPDPDLDTAFDRVERIVDTLSEAATVAGAGLATAGIDLWSDGDVPVQLEVPRYVAMSEYFRRRDDPAGLHLMSSTCSMQINLDLGDEATAPRRWELSNLVAPVFTAAFAASPTPTAANGRATGWRGIDPTRTGIPPALLEGEEDPVEHALVDTLRADVMFVQRDGGFIAGEPGWRFADWVDHGHPGFGRPTIDDLELHLTTLWPEARLRGGYIEIRTIDAIPRRWRSAVAALTVGLLYDPTATDEALRILRPHLAELPDLVDRAARLGLEDPTIHRLAAAVLTAAGEGADRLGLRSSSDAAAFVDAHIAPGGHLADDLRDAMSEGSRTSFRWARVTS